MVWAYGNQLNILGSDAFMARAWALYQPSYLGHLGSERTAHFHLVCTVGVGSIRRRCTSVTNAVLAVTVIVLSTNWASIGRFTSLTGQNYDVQEGTPTTNYVRRITDEDGTVLEVPKSSTKGKPLAEKRIVPYGAGFPTNFSMSFSIPPSPPSPIRSQLQKE